MKTAVRIQPPNIEFSFYYDIDGLPICSTLFKRIYFVSDNRFEQYAVDVMEGLVYPPEHGNTGQLRNTTNNNLVVPTLAQFLATETEPSPSSGAYILPTHLSMKRIFEKATNKVIPSSSCHLYMKHMKSRVHRRKVRKIYFFHCY